MKIVKLSEIDQIDLQSSFENVVVIPTETVYGLAARIDNETALKNIFKIKGRPSDNPLIVHVSSLDMVKTIIEGDIPEEYKPLIEKYWPGPLTLVFKGKSSISPIINGSVSGTIAVRMPANIELRNLIEKLGCPLAAPSANSSGKPSPTSLDHVIDDLGDKVSLYIDNGSCDVGVESTVFGIIDGQYLLLRPGIVTKEQLEEVLGRSVTIKNKVNMTEKVISPGQKYKHYSPNNPVYLFKEENWQENMKNEIEKNKNVKIGILIRDNLDCPFNFPVKYSLGNTVKDALKHVFSGLRYLDKRCEIIFVLGYNLDGEGLAIMDRLEKAASVIL